MIDAATRDKIKALYNSPERRSLILIRKCIAHPLGDWQCTPNLYMRKQRTAKLTAELLSVQTMPIPIEEQLTDRMAPLEV